MAMAGKVGGLSFGFGKKAEPKRYVAALSTKQADTREEIKSMEEGKLELQKPKEGQGPPVIKCKNPLQDHQAATLAKREATAKLSAQKPKLDKPLEECEGGIVSNISKLSDEDAEAMRELLKDAQRDGDGEGAPVAASMPILMKAGSKKAREAGGAEASKDMFDNMPVESFGEAMLRGMGFDPNKHKTAPIFRDKLRDNLLGLGAKALLPGEKLQIANKRKAPSTKAADSSKGAAIAGCRAAPVAAKSGIAASADADAAADEAAPEPAQKKPKAEDPSSSSSKPAPSANDVWASRGLVVKIISEEGQLKNFFGVEAVVLEVDESKNCCRLKARPKGADKSEQLKGVRLEEIETRVSRDTQKVRVVRGPKKGTVAKLLKRDSARGVAVLSIDGSETEMSLDDVCQFMGE